jgi:cytochrome c-type biogenesis protein CcmH
VSRSRIAWLLLAATVVVALVWAAWPSDGDRIPNERARELATELRCPDCESLSVADSHTTLARAIRREIRKLVGEGRSDDQIRQYYVDRYDEAILLEPEGSGLGVLVWGLPAAALVLGGAGLVLALRRWRAEPRLHSTDADERLVTTERDRERP